ncbi:PAS domain-containing protein [Paraburkholderia rhizosphaerae]|uniref:histidine kinase n=1 Tax=Paraburkholderia rhizosphaerae TaxID=480658 RepID=A0A4R8LHK5_9BURK|nr:PAS domain-containing protein [Paraburkholderia rhizosphaerae]TDY42706.1 PAS domain S-box-containing protein [Paraburkholderia rhizosphaerae]
MSLKWKLIWPATACALLILVGLATSPVPAWVAGHLRSGLLVVVAATLAVVLVVLAAAVERRLCRPLRAILHTVGDVAARDASGNTADELVAVQRAVERLRNREKSLGNALDAAEARRSALAVELQYSEERYVLAMRIADDGAWEWNLQTNEFIPSTRWKCMLGYGDDEFPDSIENWRGHIHPLDLAGVDARLKRGMEGNERQFEHQFRLLHRDGQYRWVSSLGTVIRHASGKPLRIVALDTDITRVKHIERVLQHIVEGTAGMGGEAFFRALVRHFAAALDVPCAFITECIGWPPRSAQTLAYWLRDDFRENIEFELAGTPCEAVYSNGRPVFHASGVGKLFPRDKAYESYYGIPIFGTRGEVIGHMAFFNDKEMKEQDVLIDAVYQIFTTRAAAEIERKAALDSLRHVRLPADAPDVSGIEDAPRSASNATNR